MALCLVAAALGACRSDDLQSEAQQLNDYFSSTRPADQLSSTIGLGTEPPPLTGTGTATLSWYPPMERADGSPLLDLAGYKIYWGQSPESLLYAFKVANPGIASYVVTGLTAGTWYFAITAFDSQEIESRLSAVASKTF